MKQYLASIALLTGLTANAVADDNLTLPMTCHDIPATEAQLCTAEINSPDQPVQDVIFFKRSKEDDLTLLFAKKADIALIYVAAFSKNGRYTVIGEAEEGHPSFFIYETKEFLNPDSVPAHVASLSDYTIRALIALDDSGLATVLASPCSESQAGSQGRQVQADDPLSSDDECYLQLDVFEKSAPRGIPVNE